MDLIIDSDGEDLVARRLYGISGRVIDVEPVMPVILDQVRDATARQFATEGREGSGGWEALAASTVARKGHGRVLRDTGALESALAGETGDSVAITSPDGLDYGTTLPYATFHQHGTSRMPQRRPAQLSDRVRRDVVRTLQRYVITGELAA